MVECLVLLAFTGMIFSQVEKSLELIADLLTVGTGKILLIKFRKGSTHISSKHDMADKIGPWLLYASVLTGEDLSPITDYLIKDQDKY